jgi:hypothetical protein
MQVGYSDTAVGSGGNKRGRQKSSFDWKADIQSVTLKECESSQRSAYVNGCWKRRDTKNDDNALRTGCEKRQRKTQDTALKQETVQIERLNCSVQEPRHGARTTEKNLISKTHPAKSNQHTQKSETNMH